MGDEIDLFGDAFNAKSFVDGIAMNAGQPPRRPRHAIPTEYKGAMFRSRLEARWAATFDILQMGWVYEPFDMGG